LDQIDFKVQIKGILIIFSAGNKQQLLAELNLVGNSCFKIDLSRGMQDISIKS